MANLYSNKDAEGMGNGKLELLARCCAHGKFDLYSLSMPNLSVWCDRTPKWRPFVRSSCRRAADWPFGRTITSRAEIWYALSAGQELNRVRCTHAAWKVLTHQSSEKFW